VNPSDFVNHVNHTHGNTIAATKRTESKNYAVPFFDSACVVSLSVENKKEQTEKGYPPTLT
jgi:hypothetical protein